MTQRDEITRARREKRKKIRRRRINGFLLALAVLLAAVLLANSITATTFKDVGDFFKTAFCLGSYPVEFDGARPVEAQQLGMSYAVLSESNLSVYSSSGGLLQRYAHGYISPSMRAGGNRVVVFNRGGKEVTVLNRSRVVTSLKTEHKIIDAALSDSGVLGVLTESERYTCQLEIYKNGLYEKTMTWYGSSGFPLSVTMQQSGSRAATVTLSTASGRIRSTITAVDTSSMKELFTVTLDGIAVRLAYQSSGAVIAVTDEAAYLIKSDGTVSKTYEYGSRTLLYVASDEGSGVALAFGDNNLEAINTLTVLNKNLAERMTVSCGTVKDMYFASNEVFVLGSDRVSVYSLSGNLKRSYAAPNNTIAIADLSRLVAILPDRGEALSEKLETEE